MVLVGMADARLNGTRCEVVTPSATTEADSVATVALLDEGREMRVAHQHLQVVCACPSCTEPQTSGTILNLCAGCMSVAFCSKSCQRVMWRSTHKHRCAALKADRERFEAGAGAA